MQSCNHKTLCYVVQIIWIILSLSWALIAPGPAWAAAMGDCSSERGLAGRTDIVFCEPWENSNWWQNGYSKSLHAGIWHQPGHR